MQSTLTYISILWSFAVRMIYFFLFLEYLTDWHDMRQQVNDDRIRARHLLHLSQQIVKLGLRAEEELSHIKTSFNHTWFENNSLSQIKDLISYEIDLENQNRQVRIK